MKARLRRWALILTTPLTPARRRRIYGLVAAVGVLVTATGLVTTDVVTSWAGVVIAGVDVFAYALASYKAKRAEWSATYAVLAALVLALKAAGVIADGPASHVLDILAAAGGVAAFLPWWRTDPDTPTGEPVAEWEDRVGPEAAARVRPYVHGREDELR